MYLDVQRSRVDESCSDLTQVMSTYLEPLQSIEPRSVDLANASSLQIFFSQLFYLNAECSRVARRLSCDLLSLALTCRFSPLVGLLKLPDSSHRSLASALNGAAT